MKKMTSILLWIMLCGVIYMPLYAQEKWTPKDIVNQERVSAITISDDNNYVVWVKRRPDKKKNKMVSDLYLTLLDIKEDELYKTIKLTHSSESDYAPLFSKNGEDLYFLSSREGGKKLWKISLLGGEAQQVYEHKAGISSIRWLNDQTLIFKSNEGETLYEKNQKERKDATMVIEDTAHVTVSRLYTLDIKDKTLRRLTENEYPIMSYTVSKNGQWLITSHKLSPHYYVDAKPKPLYYLWNLKTKQKYEVMKGMQTPYSFQFTEDNRGLYFAAVQSKDPQWEGSGIGLLYYMDLNTRAINPVNLDWSLGLGGAFFVVKNDVFVHLANRTSRKLAFYRKTKNGFAKYPIESDKFGENIDIMKVTQDGRQVLFSYSTAEVPPEYYIGKIRYNRRSVQIINHEELFKINDYLKKKNLVNTEVITWQGALDEDVTGILYYPQNYNPQRRYPLIVAIHGGPSSVDLDRWSERWAYYPQLMAQKEVFILKPNYHGSSYHGQEFVESIKGRYYELELIDITKGINHLNREGYIDMDSLGVMGWSNGAILTTMLTVEYPHLFKAAVPGAGDVNWTSDYGTCRFGVTFDQSYFGGAPWDNSQGYTFNMNYILKSPLFEMEKVLTPTLIFHGSEDRAVPRDQGWEYYRALQQIGKAPVRFLWFPNERHSLSKLSHQLRKINEEMAWFDTYLFNKPPSSKNEVLKTKSPLSQLQTKNKLKQYQGYYGYNENGKLLPETKKAKDKKYAIGVFEITNAQYQSYDPQHTYPSPHANYPVTELDINAIQGYISWLNQNTNHGIYRLPNEKEAQDFHKAILKKYKNGNTAYYWTGYNFTYDEWKKIKGYLMNAKSTLLKPVGSFEPITIDGVQLYDMVGNAMEIYLKDNALHYYGFSAISMPDNKTTEIESPIKYVGFRILLESK